MLAPPSRHALESRQHRLVVGCRIENSEMETCVPALELSSETRSSDHQSAYLPVRFTPDEKLAAVDKLLLAFDGVALCSAVGELPSKGKIIHGRHCSTTVVFMEKLISPVHALIGKITKQHSAALPPPLVLNKHCPACEFQLRCRKLALEKDDLSLLSNLTAEER